MNEDLYPGINTALLQSSHDTLQDFNTKELHTESILFTLLSGFDKNQVNKCDWLGL